MERGASIRVPHGELTPEALRGVIAEFVTRDGTELTEAETKIRQVADQLRRGLAEIWFDPTTGSCNILTTG